MQSVHAILLWHVGAGRCGGCPRRIGGNDLEFCCLALAAPLLGSWVAASGRDHLPPFRKITRASLKPRPESEQVTQMGSSAAGLGEIWSLIGIALAGVALAIGFWDGVTWSVV